MKNALILILAACCIYCCLLAFGYAHNAKLANAKSDWLRNALTEEMIAHRQQATELFRTNAFLHGETDLVLMDVPQDVISSAMNQWTNPTSGRLYHLYRTTNGFIINISISY